MQRDLRQRIVLVKVTFSAWQASKTDKRATQDLRSSIGNDRGRVVKRLVDSAEYKRIGQAATKIRTYNYLMSTPWDDKDWRAISTRAYPKYRDHLDTLELEYSQAVQDFANIYPDIVASAPYDMGPLYDPADFPTNIQGCFTVKRAIDTLPDTKNLMLELADDDLTAIRTDVESAFASKLQASQKNVADRLIEAISHLSERLTVQDGSKDKIFRDTLTGNLQELVDLIPDLNIANDPRINELADRARATLLSHSPQDLRDNPTIRQTMAKQAKTILDDMASLYA